MMHIGLIGEYNPQVKAHIAIPRAIELAADDLGCQFYADWVPTVSLDEDTGRRLANYHALWFVPNTPYVSMDGALRGLRYAREQRVPTLGTCGGCQYMIIEYARNVLGMSNADHAEDHPDAEVALITPLICSNTEITTTCRLTPESRVATLYGKSEVTEQYGTCNYGPNAAFWPALLRGGLRITGADADSNARVVEIDEHPFYIGTLFQPERSAFMPVVHPLIRGLLQVAQETRAA